MVRKLLCLLCFKKITMTENEVSNKVIDIAIEIHKAQGPGLSESIYNKCMYYEIRKSGLWVEKKIQQPLIFEDVKLDCGYRINLLAEKKLMIEIKSVETLRYIHLAHTLAYLKLGNYKLGLVINFNVVLLKHGIKRVINGTTE